MKTTNQLRSFKGRPICIAVGCGIETNEGALRCEAHEWEYRTALPEVVDMIVEDPSGKMFSIWITVRAGRITEVEFLQIGSNKKPEVVPFAEAA